MAETKLSLCLFCSKLVLQETSFVQIPYDQGHCKAHTSCFRCMDCSMSLIDKEFVVLEVDQESPSLKQSEKPEECASTGTTLPLRGQKLVIVCEDDYYKRKGSMCHHCKEPIKANEQASLVEGNMWHSKHLECTKCGIKLDQKAYTRQGVYYCQKDFVGLFLVCAGCDEKIVENCSVGMGKFWHKDCFKCALCGQTILQNEEFVYKEKSAFHQRCFNDANPQCAKCHKPCEQECVEFQSKQYHPKCFVCTQCGAVLDPTKFLLIDGKRCCPSHAQFECCVCNQPILGGFVHIAHRKWHLHHFRCDRCRRSLKLGQEHVLPHVDRVLCRQCIHGGEGSVEPIVEESLETSQLTHVQDPSHSINLSNISIEQALLTTNDCPEESIKMRQDSPQSSVKTQLQALEDLKKISDSPISDCLTTSTTKKKQQNEQNEESKQKPKIMGYKKEESRKAPPVKGATRNRNFRYQELKEYKLKEVMKEAIKGQFNLSKAQKYLTDAEFERVFHLSRQSFQRLPAWRKLQLKEKAGLF